MAGLDVLRKEINNFCEEIEKEYYLHFSGQKEKYEIQPIYKKYGFLFSKDLVFEMKDAALKEKKKAGENFHNLFGFVLFGWIDDRLKKLKEELAERESSMKISIRDEELSYRAATVKIMNTDDFDLRRETYFSKIDADKLLTKEFYEPKWKKTYEMVNTIGLGSYLDTVQAVSRVDYSALAKLMKNFIDDTEEIYLKTFDDICREKLGKNLSECGVWDASYLFRAKELDEFFPKEKLVPCLKRFFTDFGFPIDDVKAITLDLDERPNKVPRAFCASVVIGKEVYINLQPVGGRKDYTTLLHEAGHAYHFAFTDPSLNVDITHLGDRAISEGYAFLFNYLPENTFWCQKYLDVSKDDADQIRKSELQQKLFFLRRYGAKLNYEIELHKDNAIDGKSNIYKEKLQNALKFEVTPEIYLIDLDTTFYVADYLRAWIWEVQLRKYLEEKYGTKWFMDNKAGNEIADLWRLGSEFSPEELARKIGYHGLDIEPIKNAIIDGLV